MKVISASEVGYYTRLADSGTRFLPFCLLPQCPNVSYLAFLAWRPPQSHTLLYFTVV